MAISVFKARAPQVIARVAKTRQGTVITKRGKPVAQIVPYQSASTVPPAGKLAHTLVFERDVVSPLTAEV